MKKMTAEEAIAAYTEKFGGWPYFLFMGAEDSEIVEAVEEALKSGQKIRPVPDPGQVF